MYSLLDYVDDISYTCMDILNDMNDSLSVFIQQPHQAVAVRKASVHLRQRIRQLRRRVVPSHQTGVRDQLHVSTLPARSLPRCRLPDVRSRRRHKSRARARLACSYEIPARNIM